MDSMIGFRVKLEDNKILEEFIKEYSSLFKRYEIKVTKSFYNEEYFKSIIRISKMYLKDSFSFHLMKNILENKENLERCKYLFEILEDMEYEGLLITHIPIDIDFQTYKYTLGYLSKVLPINNMLLLENVVVNDNIGYLKKIDELFIMLDQYNLDNIKFCLDFGHLLFSFYKEGFTQYQALESLEKYKNILKNVKEIHLHDFNISSDHLHLKEGMIDLDQLSNFIEANYIRCPIILETTIKNPKEDGKQQVEIAKKLIV